MQDLNITAFSGSAAAQTWMFNRHRQIII